MSADPSSSRLRAAARARAGGLPRAFWWLWTGTLVNRLGTFVEPFLVLYLTAERGLSVGQAGAVLGIYGAGTIIAQPLGGSLADRVGRRSVLAGSLILSALVLGGLGAARDPWLIAGLAFLLGVIGDCGRPAVQAAVADLVPFEDRRRAAGLQFWAVNLGFSAAAVAGGALASAGYGLLFALDALTCLAYGLMVLRFVPETRPQAARDHRGPGWRAIAADRPVLGLLAINLVAAYGFFQLFGVLPLAMGQDGLGPAVYGAVIALNGVLIVVLHPLASTVLLRHDPSDVLAASWAFMALGALVLGVAEAVPGYMLGVLLFTLGEIGSASTGPGLIGELAPAALRGRYNGAYGMSFTIGAALGPVVGTQLLGPRDAIAPWLAAAALSAGCVVAQLALRRTMARRRVLAAALEGAVSPA
jgi:MFS family permease